MSILQNYISSVLNEAEESNILQLYHPDLSIYETESTVVVEAALAGLTTDEIDLTYHQGILTIRGNKKENENDKIRTYYRKANRSYTYRLAVPGNVDENQEPHAEYKNGVMTVSFQKLKKAEPKRIRIN